MCDNVINGNVAKDLNVTRLGASNAFIKDLDVCSISGLDGSFDRIIVNNIIANEIVGPVVYDCINGNLSVTNTPEELGDSMQNTYYGCADRVLADTDRDRVAVGFNSGITQENGAVAVGANAGIQQGTNAIAVGYNAGSGGGFVQRDGAVAIGANAGGGGIGLFSGINTVAVGHNAGGQQLIGSVAVGHNAGGISQGLYGVAIGPEAGRFTGGESVCIGYQTGSGQSGTVAIGSGAMQTSLGTNISNIAIGRRAGNFEQEAHAIAIGASAGFNLQEQYAVAVGW